MRTPPAARWTTTSAAVLAVCVVVAAGACGDGSSEPGSQPARIELTVAPHRTVAGDRLEARAFYRRGTGASAEQVTLATRDLALSNAEQQLSVPVELRDCLRDERRASRGSTCVVDVALSLRAASGEVLLADTMRNVSLAPNDVYRVAQPVLLERPDGLPLVTFTDPANDTITPRAAGSPRAVDARSVAINVKRDSLIVTLRFGEPITSNAPVGVLEIDADENPLTGVDAIMDIYGAASGLGVDYAVVFDASIPAALVLSIDDQDEVEIPAAVRGDAIVVRVPLSRIGGDANFDFGGIIGTGDRPTDWFPNTGVYTIHAQPPGAAAQVASPAARDAVRPGRAPRMYAPWRR